jgi:hypothetical protein
LYPPGSRLTTPATAVAWPISTEALARTSSSTSGLFFWGMMLLPVPYSAGSVK